MLLKLLMLSKTAATKIKIQDRTETILALQPALMNKYVTGKDALRTQRRTQNELLLFFFFVNDAVIS